MIDVRTTEVLDLPGVIITSQNAASAGVLFLPSPEGLSSLDRGRIFAQYWTNHPTEKEKHSHQLAMQAEVLVPDMVESLHFDRVRVSCVEARDEVAAMRGAPPIIVDPGSFFGYVRR